MTDALILGYHSGRFGVAEMARSYRKALELSGLRTEVLDLTRAPLKGLDTASLFRSSTVPISMNLICVNPDEVFDLLSSADPSIFKDRRNIGVWWWELPDFPEKFDGAFKLFDEIWTGSSFVARSIGRRAPIPVVVIPPVVEPVPPSGLTRGDLGIPADEFIFYFTFDLRSVFERKNPLAVVEAFRAAFKPEEKVRLLFKSINAGHDPKNVRVLQDKSKDLRVTFLDRSVGEAQKSALIEMSDAVVSLHRAEGFGMTLAEGMYFEKPVIATGWSGNTDFMTVNNSYLAPFDLVFTDRAYGPYPERSQWARPDIKAAAGLMRRVFEDRGEAREKGIRAGKDMREFYSAQVSAQAVRARSERAPLETNAPGFDAELWKESHRTAQEKIRAMQATKFWKLRSAYFEIKNRLGFKSHA